MSEGRSPDLRASDAEREVAAERLRVAAGEGRLTLEELTERMDAAYDARTRGDLERLLADLPAAGSLEVAGATGVGAGPASAGRPDLPHARQTLVAVMCGSTLSGICRVGPTTNAVAIMGGVDIDLNDAVLEAREVVINVTVIMGGVEVRVPEGVHVVNEVLAIMGGVDVKAPGEAPPPGAPVVRLRGVAIMGGVDVKRGRSRRDRRRLERAAAAHGLRRPPEPPEPPSLSR